MWCEYAVTWVGQGSEVSLMVVGSHGPGTCRRCSLMRAVEGLRGHVPFWIRQTMVDEIWSAACGMVVWY